METAGGRFIFRGVIAQQLMIQSKNAGGIAGGFKGIVVTSAAYVFKKFVYGSQNLEHGIVFPARADQMRQGKLFFRQVKLQRVAEGNLKRIVLSAGAAFKKIFALFTANEELGRLT